MSTLREQRKAIKFYVRLNKTVPDTYDDLKQAFGNDAMSRAFCFRWFKDFKDGREDPELQGGDGAPVTAFTEETVNTAAAMIKTDRRLTVRQIARLLDISLGSAHTI